MTNTIEQKSGTHHYSKITSLLQNYDIAVKATEKSINSQNSALEENEKYLNSVAGRYATFKVQLEETYLSIVSSDFLKGTISGLSTFTSLIKDSVDNVGLLGVVLGGLSAYLTTFKGGFKIFDIQNFKSIEGIFSGGILNKMKALKANIALASAETKIMAQSTAIMNGQLNPTLLQKLSAGFRAVGASAKFAEIQAIAFKGATVLLNGAVGLFGGAIAGMAISGIMSWIMNIGKADEKTKEFIQTCQSNISANNDSIKSLTSLKGEYEELTSATNLNAEQSKRLVEVKNELGRLSPSLIAGYTEEGDVILKQNANIQEQIDLLNKKNKIESKKIIDEALKNDGGTENKIKDNENKISKLQTGDIFKGQDSIDKYLKAMGDAEKRIMNAKTEAEAKMYQKQYDEAYDKYYKMNNELQEAKEKIDTLRESMESLKPHVLAVNDSFQSMDKPTQNIVNNILEADNALKEVKSSEEYVSRIRKIIDLINSSNTAPFIKEINDLNEQFKNKGATEEYKKALDGIIQKILALPNLKNLGIDKDMLTKALSVNASEVDLSGVDKAIDKVAELNAMSSEDLGKNFNEITKKIQDLNEVLYNLDNGKLVGQNLSNAIEKYPELLGLLGDEASMRQYITDLIAQENEVQTQTYQAMIENSQAFYDAKVKGNTELVNRITELYGVDLTQFNTLAEAKLEIERRLIEKLAGYWSKYYDVASKSFDMEQATKDTHDVGRARYYQQQANMAELEMMNQKAEFDKLIGELSKPVDFKKINMGKSQVKDATKKEKKKKEKKEKEPFQQDVIANQQKKLNLELEKYNKLLEDSAKHTKKHLEYLKEKRELLKQQIELTKKEIAYQSQLSRTALPPTTGSSSSGGTITLGNGATSKIDAVIQNAVDNYTNHKVQYVYGGKSLKNGIDCSGFMVELYKQMGIEISGGTAQLSKKGVKVDKNSLQKGDLVFFKGANQHGNGIGHVGMYIGNGQYIHAANKKDDVKVSNLSSAKDFVTARRIANFGGSSSTVKPTTANNKKFTITYYTDLPSENGGYTTNAYGQKLQKGMVASNYYKKGTKIYLDGIGEVTVADTGGSAFNKDNRLDVFVPRNAGESNSAYLKRVNAMGKKTVNGAVVDSNGNFDTSYITNENRQKAFDGEITARQKLLDLLQQQKDLEFEIKKAERIYMDQANIERLEKLITRSEEFYKGKASGSDDAIRNLDDVLVRYEQILISQDKIRNELLDLSKDQTITEAQRYQALQEHYDAEIKYWQTKTTYQETYLKKVKEQLYGKSEVEINYKEGVKRRNLTQTSYYMENTPENLKALENALKIQREITEMREKEKNDAYNLYNDKEHRKNLSAKQIQDLKQEYIDRDNVFYEARKELDELTKKAYEVKLEVKLKLPNYKIEQLKRELEIVEAKDPENYEDKTRLNKWIHENEIRKKSTIEQELKDLEKETEGIQGYIDLLKKYDDAESKRVIAEREKELKTKNDLIEETKKKLEEQKLASAESLRNYLEAYKEELDFKLNVKLELKDEEIDKIKNKITALESYNDEDYGGILELNKDVLEVESEKEKEIQKQIVDLYREKYRLEEESKKAVNQTGDGYLKIQGELKKVNEAIDESTMKLSDQEAIIAQQVRAYIDAQRNLLDNQTQNAIFGKDKADYEYEMGLRIDDYNKQIKAIEDEAKFLTGDEKKWQIDLIRDDIKSQTRNLENPAQKVRIEAFYEELKVLESIDNLEQDRVDKVKYQLDIEKAKIKLENLQNQKSIRALKKGEDGTFKWTYVADQDAIDQAQKELKEKQYEFSKWTTDKDREDRKEAIQDKIDAENEKYDNMVKSYEAQMRLIDQNLKAQAVLIMQAKKEENEKFKKALEDKQKIADEKGAEEVKNLIDHNTIMNDTLDAGLKTLKKTNELQWTSMVNTTSEKVKEMQKLIDSMVANLERIKSLESAIASANAKLEETKSKSSTSTEGSNSKSDSSSGKSAGKSMASLDTGGYTGSFSGGRIAMLHEKELVLNKADTKNILDSVKLNRSFVGALKKFDFSRIINSIPKTSSSTVGGDTYKVEKLYVELPNVTSAVDTIKETFYDLSSGANQYFSKV